MSEQPKEPYGLRFGNAKPASDLHVGEIVVLDGHLVDVQLDPADSRLVRLTLVRALGPPPGTRSDQREIELTCPRDMIFATAEPHNIDLAPTPGRS